MQNEPVRCKWCLKDPLYIKYHDEEWGVPVHNDLKHYEFLVLEAAQAGLSWLTILRRRSEYSRAFDHFDPVKVAGFDKKKVGELLENKGIIRNRLKIESAINNAAKFLKVTEEFGSFDSYIWHFTSFRPVINSFETENEIPATSPLSDMISKDLKKRGFSFMGSTIVYSHLQATGIINDHVKDCFRFTQLTKEY